MNADATRAGRPVTVVTGAGRGIGRAVALLLAESGHDLVLNDLDPDALREAAAEVGAATGPAGCRVEQVAGDVADERTPGRIVTAARAAFGRLDGVVNNAGAGLTVPFARIAPADWEAHFAVHVHAAARLCQAALPLLTAASQTAAPRTSAPGTSASRTAVSRTAAPRTSAPGAAVVNVSSVAAALSLPNRVAYTSAKSAVEGFTRALAAEWADLGIRVNAVAPGTILTPLVARNFAGGLLSADRVLERTPLGRLGEPREVATAVRFLLSADASYVTGQTLRVDGGWSIWGGW